MRNTMERNREYEKLIIDYAKKNYKKMFREPAGFLKYKFIVPGSVYSDSLWDWDSWLTDIALDKICAGEELFEYEKGCVLNFCEYVDGRGQMPITVMPNVINPSFGEKETNIHKPCLAIHALFISRKNKSFEWLKPVYSKIESYIQFYLKNCRHETGLFFWIDDYAIGVDNDPCTFYRPKKSSLSIYLNCMMYKEFNAIAEISGKLGREENKIGYKKYADELKAAIQSCLWDERNGFFYSADANLLSIDKTQWLHSGAPRNWSALIQKIDVWSGFMAMWAEIASSEQAKRMVYENYMNIKTFNAPYGVRTLSKLEKMYQLVKSGNPSCWLGPVWGISNYMVFDGLVKYGYEKEAYELAVKTVNLFGRDIERCGEMHEYYNPETGEGINNPGFQNWNLLVLNMIDWLENRL